MRLQFEDSEHGRWLEAGDRFQAEGAVAERMALMWAQVAAVLARPGSRLGEAQRPGGAEGPSVALASGVTVSAGEFRDEGAAMPVGDE